MNIYQEEILDHYRRPRHRGAVSDPSHRATQTNPLCGDELTATVRVSGGSISDLKFDGQGCAISQAAASMLAEELHGRSMTDLRSFSDREMLELIGVELSPARQKCGLLAIATLREAIAGLE